MSIMWITLSEKNVKSVGGGEGGKKKERKVFGINKLIGKVN
jgi:hypothetical protein